MTELSLPWSVSTRVTNAGRDICIADGASKIIAVMVDGGAVGLRHAEQIATLANDVDVFNRADLASFHNRLRIMASLDLAELRSHGAFADDGGDIKWVQFRDDPYRYMLRCSDDEAERIWAALRAREVPRRKMVMAGAA